MTAPFDRSHHPNRALTRRGHPHMTDVTRQWRCARPWSGRFGWGARSRQRALSDQPLSFTSGAEVTRRNSKVVEVRSPQVGQRRDIGRSPLLRNKKWRGVARPPRHLPPVANESCLSASRLFRRDIRKSAIVVRRVLVIRRTDGPVRPRGVRDAQPERAFGAIQAFWVRRVEDLMQDPTCSTSTRCIPIRLGGPPSPQETLCCFHSRCAMARPSQGFVPASCSKWSAVGPSHG